MEASSSVPSVPPTSPGRSPLYSNRALPFAKIAVILSTAVGNALSAPLHTATASDPLTAFSHGRHTDEPPRSNLQLAMDLLSIAGLVILGGVAAGLTLALMGLDELHLQVLSSSGTETERKRATKVLRLLARGKHWVLVVLLLSNVIVNETLPVFLSDFGGGFAAVVISTVLIVIFGEIVPQSVCARYGLAIGAACAPFVHLTMLIFAPIAWPTAKLLDWCLGEDHGTTYRKAELKTFVSLHQTLGAENLSEDEVTIIRAVLDLNDKTVRDVMTPIEDVFILSADTILDDDGVNKLVSSGYSRVPIHEPGKPDAILGMLLVKKLIQYDPEDAMPVSWFNLTPLPEASPDLTLLDCLNYFQQGRSHMLLVSSAPGESKGALGVVTLEDVIEEMIGEEIIDETDVYVDVTNKVRVERKREQIGGGQGAWAPLIKGIIERRRKFGGSARTPLRSSYGVPASNSAGLPGPPPPSGVRALDKVQVKRSGSPTSYSESGTPLDRTSALIDSRRSSSAFSPRAGHATLSRGASYDASVPAQQKAAFQAGQRHQQQKQKELESNNSNSSDAKSNQRGRERGSISSTTAVSAQGDADSLSGLELNTGDDDDDDEQQQQQQQRGRSSGRSGGTTAATTTKGSSYAAVASSHTADEDGGNDGGDEGAKTKAPKQPFIVELSPNGGDPQVVLTPDDIPRSGVESPERSRQSSRDETPNKKDRK